MHGAQSQVWHVPHFPIARRLGSSPTEKAGPVQPGQVMELAGLNGRAATPPLGGGVASPFLGCRDLFPRPFLTLSSLFWSTPVVSSFHFHLARLVFRAALAASSSATPARFLDLLARMAS